MSDNLSNFLNTPLAIGSRRIDKRLVLAPMTVVGNVAFRELISSFSGFGLLFSEMCSAKRIPYENRRSSAYFRWRDAELPRLVCQIVGDDPPVMAAAARIIEAKGFFGVDINFGCSAASICGQHSGAALLKEPQKASSIVAAVRKAVSIPLFVKFRTGWRDDPLAAVDLARRFEDAGADALTFHPRVAPDRRTRPPKWEYIAGVKAAVTVPVFGNGDVFSRDDCRKILQDTGCDGVAVGRMAVARPWLFAEWTDRLKTDSRLYLESAHKLITLLSKHFDPVRALRRFKRFSMYFSANFKFGHTLNTRICNAKQIEEIRPILNGFFSQSPGQISTPNMNLFR